MPGITDGPHFEVLTTNGRKRSFYLDGGSMNMRLYFEKYTPILMASVFCLIWLNIGRPFPKDPSGLLGTAATVASVLASFLGVSLSIILTIKDSALFKKLAAHGYDREIFAYLRSGIYGSATFAGLSMTGFFITGESQIVEYGIQVPFQAVWLFVAVYALSAFIRMTNIQFKMLRQTMI